MPQPRLLFAVWIACALLASLPVYGDTPKGRKPNFIFVLSDDIAQGDLGCYGQQLIHWELHRGSKPVQAARFDNWKAIRNGIDKAIEIYDLGNDAAESTDLAEARPDLVQKAQKIFEEAHRADPNWPLERRADAHTKSAAEAWEIKRRRDREKRIPDNAVNKRPSLRAGCDLADEEAADPHMTAFQQLSCADWTEVFHDPCTANWSDRWTLDGLKATVTSGEKGMDFKSGPVRKDDASHAVMWTKDSFQGDIRLDYEYTKLDDAVEAVTILYLQATGSGSEGYDKDIARWSDQREVASMRTYFDHMHLLHISYAAFNVGNTDPNNDYIRARRYMPESGEGLTNTGLEPDYLKTGLFKKGVPHNITVIKKGNDLFMHIRNREKQQLCHWKTNSFPPILEGRIGLRHMWTRAARYRDFRISQLNRNVKD